MAAAKKKKAAATPSGKFGVDYVAKAMGITAATARIKLRNAKIKKPGKSYTWDSKAEADKAVSQLQSAA